MGKRPAGVGLFGGNMVSMQWETRPSMQRDEPPTMETGPEQIADGAWCASTRCCIQSCLALGRCTLFAGPQINARRA